jgi:hypothetical protein
VFYALICCRNEMCEINNVHALYITCDFGGVVKLKFILLRNMFGLCHKGSCFQNIRCNLMKYIYNSLQCKCSAKNWTMRLCLKYYQF